MKKLLVIAVALAAVNAQATRARVAALGNSPSLVDTATVYNNPADIFALGGDYVTLESGVTDTFAAPNTVQGGNAEGMIVRTMGDAKMGLSLGHEDMNASAWGLRNVPAPLAAFAVNQQNPLELTYGAKAADMNWAGTLVYSNYDDKKADNKENSLGVRFGARAANWDAAVRVGLASTVDLGGVGKYTGATAIGVNGGYQMDSIYWVGNVATSGFKVENTAGVEQLKFTGTQYAVGAETTVKKDSTALMYGAKIAMTDTKATAGGSDVKNTSTTLPVWISVEADAASWLTLRGSVTQTVLIDSTKQETTPVAGGTDSEFSPGTNNTTVAFGAGLKFNKVTVDGTLSTATTQVLNSNSLLTQVGMSYWF
ncbi:MAG: hypothetical protein ACXVAX_08885 [Pseudobdellovibrio sp.]